MTLDEITAGLSAAIRAADVPVVYSPTLMAALRRLNENEIGRLRADNERLHKALDEFIYDRDGLAAWLTDRRNQAHSDGDTWSKGWHDANEEALAFLREVAFRRSSEATDAVLDGASLATGNAPQT